MRILTVLARAPFLLCVISPAAAQETTDTAIQNQLGLKLERVKAPIDVLLIDKIEQPSPN